METKKYFTIRKPYNSFLAGIVEYYFYIDAPVLLLTDKAEYMMPYPRITFGYFFDLPYKVTNNTLKTSEISNVSISKISTYKITVQPTTDRIRILGAHLKPFGLAYFTEKPISSLPWLINTEELFGNIVHKFLRKIKACRNTEQMFNELESVFLDNILNRDLSLITNAIELIESSSGQIAVSELSQQLGVSDRTIRNHFYEYVGCSPKEYFRIVKLKQIVYQMKHSDSSLTHTAYDNNYFDQSHFIREVKDITGHSPKNLRKKIPNFRFLQF